MADVYSQEVRSRVMARVHGRDTVPEVALRRALYALGMRGWRCHRRDLAGRPDLTFGPARVAVFIDGGFWHGHSSRFPRPSLSDYWIRKISGNMARDIRVNAELAAQGWLVLRFWDFEVIRDASDVALRVLRAVGERRQTAPEGRLADVRKSLVAQLAEQAGEPEGLSPFDRMKDLTRRLVAVPKTELDELAKRETREKATKRGAASP